MPKGSTSEPRYNPFRAAVWREYLEDGAPEDAVPIRVKIRTNLTFGELDELVWDDKTPDEELFEKFAPHVIDWNLSGIAEDGNDVDLPAPAVGGPEQFRYIPFRLFRVLMTDIKMGSTLPLARKRPSAATAPGPNPPVSTGDGPSASD